MEHKTSSFFWSKFFLKNIQKLKSALISILKRLKMGSQTHFKTQTHLKTLNWYGEPWSIHFCLLDPFFTLHPSWSYCVIKVRWSYRYTLFTIRGRGGNSRGRWIKHRICHSILPLSGSEFNQHVHFPRDPFSSGLDMFLSPDIHGQQVRDRVKILRPIYSTARTFNI